MACALQCEGRGLWWLSLLLPEADQTVLVLGPHFSGLSCLKALFIKTKINQPQSEKLKLKSIG